MSPPPTDALLLCIDMQPRFLRVVPGAAQLLQRCTLALAAARGLGLPLIFTEQVPDKLGPTAPELLALAPDAPCFGKDAFSALGDERIAAAVAAANPRELLLCGVEIPVCIFQTALAGLRAGRAVTILSDAVGGRRAEDARACLDALIRAGVQVLPGESVFYQRLGSSRHPFFKAYTQLVKDHG